MTENTAILYDTDTLYNYDRPSRMSQKMSMPRELLLSNQYLGLVTFFIAWKFSHMTFKNNGYFAGNKLKLLWGSFLLGWGSMKLVQGLSMQRANSNTNRVLRR